MEEGSSIIWITPKNLQLSTEVFESLFIFLTCLQSTQEDRKQTWENCHTSSNFEAKQD
jgi:hypothetical protein